MYCQEAEWTLYNNCKDHKIQKLLGRKIKMACILWSRTEIVQSKSRIYSWCLSYLFLRKLFSCKYGPRFFNVGFFFHICPVLVLNDYTVWVFLIVRGRVVVWIAYIHSILSLVDSFLVGNPTTSQLYHIYRLQGLLLVLCVYCTMCPFAGGLGHYILK